MKICEVHTLRGKLWPAALAMFVLCDPALLLESNARASLQQAILDTSVAQLQLAQRMCQATLLDLDPLKFAHTIDAARRMAALSRMQVPPVDSLIGNTKVFPVYDFARVTCLGKRSP